MYEHADGVAQNYSQALKYYQEAANLGSPAAQNAIGLMTSEGQGVQQDPEIAVKRLRLAAEQGDAQRIEQSRRDVPGRRRRPEG